MCIRDRDVDDLDVALEELKKKKGGNPDSAVLKSQINELQRKLKTLTDDNVAKEKLYNCLLYTSRCV